MSKGEETRHLILDHAISLATQVGLDGLSIGRLAEDLGLSKSGLFAHFKSKEALQLQVMEEAAARFVEKVVRPALRAPRGEPRVRALVEAWMAWPKRSALRGGCLFVALATELDDREGPARDTLVRLQKDWLNTLSGAARIAIEEGHFRADLDTEQFAYELYGLMLMYHHSARLLRDRRAGERTRRATDELLGRARRPRSTHN